MTMNYCGRCGSANGTAARFCRQCGAELSGQTAFSASSAPLNVEFSARNIPSEPTRETGRLKPPPGASFARAAEKTTSKNTGKSRDLGATPSEGGTTSGQEQDPKAISDSLRRIRASGPLLLDAAKKKQERISQIISESIGGTAESSHSGKIEVPREETQTALPVISSPPTQANVAPVSTKPKPANQGTTQPPTPVPVITQTMPRRSTGSLSASSSPRSTTGTLSNNGQPPPQGPSSVLAQASGLKTQSNISSKLRIGLVALTVMLAAGAYFFLRDRLITTTRTGDNGRNLMRPEDQSAFLMRAGTRDRDQGNYDSALEQFHNAKELTPNNPELLYQLAQTYASAGKTDEAFEAFQSLLRIAPENLEGRFQVAEIHRTRGNWNLAYQEYQHIITLDQNSSQAIASVAAIEAHETGKPDPRSPRSKRKRPDQQEVVAELPPPVSAQAQISLLPLRPVAAANISTPTTLTTRTEEKPDPRSLADSHKKLGLRYLNIRQYRAALNEFLSAYNLTPDDKDLNYLLGSSHHGLNQYVEANKFYRKVVSGPYKEVALAGARQTEKAAEREETKRREALQKELKNGAKNESQNEKSGKGNPTNSLE